MKWLKNNILILILIMANFVLYFRYSTTTGRLLYDDLSVSDLTGSYGIFSAYNPDTGVLYVQKNGTPNQLVAVQVSDKSELYSYNIPSNSRLPLFVDSNSRLWAIESPANKYIYIFNSDLTLYDTYTLKAGNPLSDAIYHAHPTWDMDYIYLIYRGSTGKIAKYAIAELDGGDPEWNQNTSQNYPTHVFTDEDDYPYTTKYNYLSKYDKDLGSHLWDLNGVGNIGFYSVKTGMIYLTNNTDFREVTTEGALDGDTANFSGYMAATGIYPDQDGNYFYGLTEFSTVGGFANRLFKYNATNWGTGEAAVAAQYGGITDHFMGGDPSGYFYRQLVPLSPEKTWDHPVWERRFGIGQETDWGTGVNSEIPIPVINYPDFDINSVTIESNHFSGLAYNNLVQRNRSYDAPKIQISFNAVNDYLVYFFYTLFQRVWESGSSPYPKIFIPYDESPDFSAKSGSLSPPLLSIIGDNRIDNIGHKIDGALCSNLKLEGGEGQILKTTVDLQGRDMVTNDSSSGDDFTSYSNETPLLWENATILMARLGATAGTQGIFSITSADDSQIVVSGDQTSYISNGNYLTFGITVGSSNDTIVITETAGSTVAVSITQGVYHPIELCFELQSKINQSADLANQYEITFDIVSRKFLFTRDSGSDTFIIDEEDVSMEMNGTLGFDGSNDAAGTSYESDNAITWNVKAYEITNVVYSSSTTVTVALDRDPTEGTLPQSVLIWRKINAFSMNLDFANNVKSPVRNNTVVRQHILGKFEGKGSLTIPWGLYSNDENLEINNFIAGYRTPLWIYFGGFGETDNDLAIFLNSFYTGSREISDNIIELELPFEATRDFDSNQINLPCFAVISDGDDKAWSCDLLLL